MRCKAHQTLPVGIQGLQPFHHRINRPQRGVLRQRLLLTVIPDHPQQMPCPQRYAHQRPCGQRLAVQITQQMSDTAVNRRVERDTYHMGCRRNVRQNLHREIVCGKPQFLWITLWGLSITPHTFKQAQKHRVFFMTFS